MSNPLKPSKGPLYDFTVNSEQCQGNFDCIKNATTKLSRDTILKDKVWPWQNFDWDYSQYIDNNYTPKELGITSDPTWAALGKNIKGMAKLGAQMLLLPNPPNNAVSGKTDATNCLKRAQTLCKGSRGTCVQQQKKICDKNNSIKNSYSKLKPIYSKMKTIKPTTKGSSSSYFIQTGTCPTEITEEESCLDKDYNWLSGKCWRPKYAHVDNKAFLGSFPSLVNDVVQLNPFNVIKVLKKKPAKGFRSFSCDELETFDTKKTPTNIPIVVIIAFTFSLILISLGNYWIWVGIAIFPISLSILIGSKVWLPISIISTCLAFLLVISNFIKTNKVHLDS